MSTRWGWFDSISVCPKITAIRLRNSALFAVESMAGFSLPNQIGRVPMTKTILELCYFYLFRIQELGVRT
jgi:hypothetical protein